MSHHSPSPILAVDLGGAVIAVASGLFSISNFLQIVTLIYFSIRLFKEIRDWKNDASD